VAEWVGADVVNVHGGGAYGDKQKALARIARNLKRLSRRVRSRLTVEKTTTEPTLPPTSFHCVVLRASRWSMTYTTIAATGMDIRKRR
jgi:endonuclease IV